MIGIAALLLAGGEGLRHSFETDHIAAVANLVTERDKPLHAMKDGVFWGIGHTLAILLIGTIILGFKFAIPEVHFNYLEALVGLMILGLGIHRLFSILKKEKQSIVSNPDIITANQGHRIALGVGVIHGLAGSGAVVAGALLVLDLYSAFAFIVVFGLGSILGMLIAAGILSMPFYKKIFNIAKIQMALTVLSSVFCIYIGSKIIVENIFG